MAASGCGKQLHASAFSLTAMAKSGSSLRKTTPLIHHSRGDSPRRDKTSRLYERADVFYFSAACPALTFTRLRAFGCLHGD